jgi:DNA-binding transcriptional ArsR family regulator
MTAMIKTRIRWDIGTAYDLFISLRILHDPERYGVRASWAAGVRSRVPVEHREILDRAALLRLVPLAFVNSLNEPKNATQLMAKLRSIPASEILETLTIQPDIPEEIKELFLSTTPGKKWSHESTQIFVQRFGLEENKQTRQIIATLNEVWANRKEFGDKLILGLQAYIDTFFAEEEQRILPVLQQELSYARMRAGSRPLPAMLEELTAGVRYGDFEHLTDIVLAPTFWGSPFMFSEHLTETKMIVLFGARPGTMSIIPGDIVPDGLLRGMKAMADPTRLRILRYLAQEPQTASELSRVLRLRPPTVTHHLTQLRLAGMVQVYLDPGGERKYAARYEGFEDTQDLLNRFVRGE